MNAWVQWLMPDQKPPGQPETGTTSKTVEPPVAARGNAGPGPAPSRVFRPPVSKPPEPPIRAELFGVERLEQHAESLAAAQHIASNPKQGRPLAKRLYDNTKVLTETYRAIVRANSAHQPITPAAEWLLDNFHVVDEQIREIKNDLPPGFYRKLPKLADGPLQGYPRVFGVAWALVAHTDSAFDIQKLTRFVEAYQRVQPLTIGEFWALAITLRITLVENLRRLAEAIVAQQSASQLADALADRILGTDNEAMPNRRRPSCTVSIRRPGRPHSPSNSPSVCATAIPIITPALRWLNDRLAAEGTTTDQIVRDEFQRQSAMNVTVRNVITSMRLVSMINWAEFFESVSPVDAVLRGGSDFAAMDFPTRDRYRRAIEELARKSGRDEIEVARQRDSGRQTARRTRRPNKDPRRARMRSRILPDRQRPPRLREGTGLPCAVPDAALSAQFRSGRHAAMWA